MDYRTWNNLQPGDLIKGPKGALYEVYKAERYVRGRPHSYLVHDLIDRNREYIPRIHRFNIMDYSLIGKDDKTVIAAKVLFSKG